MSELRLAPATTLDPMLAPPVRWGVLGPGGIAGEFADAVHLTTRSQIVAVGSRSAERAAAFAERYGIRQWHGSYEALVADPAVEAVYVASPHSEHHAHARLALDAGTPVLVEKAFCRTTAETDDVLDTAADAGLLAAEAMWSRYLPGYDIVRRTVAEGVIGDVVALVADHGQRLWPDGPQRLADPALAGGALLDLGVYPLAFADHVVGPLGDIVARAELSERGVDVTTGVTASGPNGELVQVWCSMAATSACTATVVGTLGRLELDGRFYGPTTVRLVAPDGRVVDVLEPEHVEHGFRYQLAEFARALHDGRTETWSVPWNATRRVMAAMDDIRHQVGVRYPGE
ncbi:MAG: Gfo/Idh/MocA family protein [Dermatophilaceae bacterium]